MTAETLFCRATLSYALGSPGNAVNQTEVDIFDGRVADLPGWQECGFELVHHNSSVQDWNDDEALPDGLYPEMERLASHMTGCDCALVSSHIRRSPEQAARHEQLSPITFVHSDFAATHESIIRGTYLAAKGPGQAALARNMITAEDVTQASRIVILQFWRNVGPTRMDYPVAFCDARSVSMADARAFHVSNYADSGYSFDALAIMASEANAHRWYAFPELRADEVVAFRTYDTDLVHDGRVFFTPHSAFRDPRVPAGSPSRVSIELRCNCLFF